MAVVIQELVVRATVNGPENRQESPSPEDLERLREEILQECTDKIMEVLRQQKER